jgi:hypothetical protein
LAPRLSGRARQLAILAAVVAVVFTMGLTRVAVDNSAHAGPRSMTDYLFRTQAATTRTYDGSEACRSRVTLRGGAVIGRPVITWECLNDD